MCVCVFGNWVCLLGSGKSFASHMSIIFSLWGAGNMRMIKRRDELQMKIREKNVKGTDKRRKTEAEKEYEWKEKEKQ